MVRLTATASEYVPIPEGEVLSARLEDVEADSYTWEGKTINKLRWRFLITEQGEYEGKTITGDTSTSFTAHPNCKAYNWVVAMTGRKYEDGEELNTDDLMGAPARVLIGNRPGKDGRVWEEVRDVLPPRGGAASAAATKPQYDESPF